MSPELAMYACIRGTGRGFFEVVCTPGTTIAYLCDPPPPIRELTLEDARKGLWLLLAFFAAFGFHFSYQTSTRCGE